MINYYKNKCWIQRYLVFYFVKLITIMYTLIQYSILKLNKLLLFSIWLCADIFPQFWRKSYAQDSYNRSNSECTGGV